MSTRAERPVLLVGGMPGASAEEVFRTAGPALGDLALGLPDGETNIRRMFVGAIAALVWAQHPDMELVRASRGSTELPRGMPAGYDDFPVFRVRPGVTELRIDNLFYATDAIASYEIFRTLRGEGVIPQDVRFQVSLPFPDDACRQSTDNAADMDIMLRAYREALGADIERICGTIPHEDLALQWDVNWETIAVDHGDYIAGEPPMDYKPTGDPLERFLDYVREFSALVPKQAKLGMHLCYGDLLHRHFLEPRDLGACVRLSNAACREAARRIDYVHMPVPRERRDDAYFEPLSELDIGASTLYIGLVHYTDAEQGSLARLDTFRRHYAGPAGIATECGLGRRPADQSLLDLLKLHRTLADAL